MEDRLKKKKDKILHAKTGSGTPVKVTFNKYVYGSRHLRFCLPLAIGILKSFFQSS